MTDLCHLLVSPALVRDVVLTKKLWEHIQKSSHFETASNSFQNKTWKRCGYAVPTLSRPTTPMTMFYSLQHADSYRARLPLLERQGLPTLVKNIKDVGGKTRGQKLHKKIRNMMIWWKKWIKKTIRSKTIQIRKMWLAAKLRDWQRNNANIKTKIRNEEFMDDMEWQRPLNAMIPDMQTVMVMYWLSISIGGGTGGAAWA